MASAEPTGRPSTLRVLRATLAADFGAPESRPLYRMSVLAKLAVLLFRLGQFCSTSNGPAALALRPLWYLGDRIYLRLLAGAWLCPTASCGPGLAFQHIGRGVSIGPQAQIGSDVLIFQHVVIESDGEGPFIGDNVMLGAYSVVYGPVIVGDGAQVGMQSSVTEDVPPGWSVAGVRRWACR